MELTIDYEYKKVRAYTQTVVDAGWLGFGFARDNPDLVKEGWEILYFSSDPFGRDRQQVQSMGIRELYQAIREGSPCTHSCPRHR